MAEGTLYGKSLFLGLAVGALAGAAIAWSVLDGGSATSVDPSTTIQPALGIDGSRGTTIARVGDEVLTEADLARLRARFPNVPDAQLLNNRIDRLILLEAAQRAGYGADAAALQSYEDAMIARFLDEELGTRLDAVTLEERELEAHLAEHPIEPPTPLRRAALLRRSVSGEADRSAERDRLIAAVADLEADSLIAHFGSVAADHSDHAASRHRGGVVGYFGPQYQPHSSIPEAVHRALWSLEAPGDISEPVDAPEAVYLVRYVDDRVEPGRDLDSRRNVVARRLLEEKRLAEREAFLASLSDRVEVVLAEGWDLEREPAEPERTPPAMPAGLAVEQGRLP